MQAPARFPTRSAWVVVAKIAVSVALLAILLRSVDFNGVAAVLVRIPVSTVAAAVTLIALQTCVQGLRWWLVMSALSSHMSLARVAQLTFVSVFFNQVLPTSVGGDAVRVWHVHRSGVRVGSAIKSVLLERIWGVLALSLLVALGLLYLGERVANAPLRIALIATLPLALLGVAAMTSFDRMPPAVRQWRALGPLLRLSADARLLFLRPPRAAPLLALSILGHVLSALVVYVLAVGLSLALSVWDCLAIVPSVLLTMVIPISFAGWGLREGAMVVLLGHLGIPADMSLAVSLMYGVVTIIAALPGSLFWLRWRAEPGAAVVPAASLSRNRRDPDSEAGPD